MIKINGEDIQIQGKGIDIAQELSGIFQTIRDNEPEMLAGVIAGWADILTEDTGNLNDDHFNAFYHLTLDWIELNEVE